jgi:hypothetical protein
MSGTMARQRCSPSTTYTADHQNASCSCAFSFLRNPIGCCPRSIIALCYSTNCDLSISNAELKDSRRRFFPFPVRLHFFPVGSHPNPSPQNPFPDLQRSSRLRIIESVNFTSFPVIFRGFLGHSRDFPSPQNRIRQLHIPSRYFSSFPGALSRLPGPAKSNPSTSHPFPSFFVVSGDPFATSHPRKIDLANFMLLCTVFQSFGKPSRFICPTSLGFRSFFAASGRLHASFFRLRASSGHFSRLWISFTPVLDAFTFVPAIFQSFRTTFHLFRSPSCSIWTDSHSFRTLSGCSGSHFTSPVFISVGREVISLGRDAFSVDRDTFTLVPDVS